jgi:hypothetical protein
MDPNSNTPIPAPAAGKPRFTIVGDSIETLAVALAEIVLKEGQFSVKENKSGNGAKYAIWDLDDGLSSGPYSAGLGLSPEQAKRLPTRDGVPTILSCSLVMRQLTPLASVAAKMTERRAATATRVTKLEAQLDAARAAQARLKE